MENLSTVSVNDVLDEYAKGKDRGYQRLLITIRSPITEKATLLCVLQQLQCSVTRLNHKYDSLVTAVLRMNWLTPDPSIRQAYIHFVTNLASAHPVYITKVLNVLVSNLTIQSRIGPGSSTQSLPSSEVYPIIHDIIQSLLQIIPLLPRHLLTASRERLPQISSPKEVQNDFIQNLFHITSYLPELREGLLDIIVHRVTEIDVHCPRSGIFIEDDQMSTDEDDSAKTIFEMDDVNGSDKKDGSKVTEGPKVTEIASALDCLMCSLFRFIDDTCHNNGQIKVKESIALYRHCLHVFEKIVLTTHCSNHVQFIMFYFCSLRKQFADNFLEFLWKKFSNPSTAVTLRQTCASYIASFLSRANFIPLGTVTACLDLISKWIHSYIDNQEESSKVAKDSSVHGPFYSICQALFYTIIYRYKELLTSQKGLQYTGGLNLTRIISCRLNPLMFCLPSVVNIFATISRKYQVAYCYTIMERNSRNISVIRAHGGAVVDEQSNPLDTFFPFDPYMLPKSSAYIHPLYHEWEGVKVTDDHRKEEEEEDFSQYEEHLQEVPLGLTPSSLSAISPGFMSP